MNPFVTVFRYLPHARQRMRRLIVLATFLGYPLVLLGYGGLVAPGRLSTVVWAPISIALMSMTILGTFAIYGFARDRASLQVESLDERQRELRDTAYVRSYVVLSTVVAALVGVAAIWATFFGPIRFDFSDMASWLVAFVVFLPILPSAVLAWIEPDVPSDEPSDEAFRA
jgi:hypothetical protein